MDQKRIVGLLVKGNKARNLVKRGMKIPTKIFHSTKQACIVPCADGVHEQSIDSTEVALDVDRNVPPLERVKSSNICCSIHNKINGVFSPEYRSGGIVDTDTNTYCLESDNGQGVWCYHGQ